MENGRKSWIEGDIFTSANEVETLHAWKPYDLCIGLLFHFQNSEIEPRWGSWQTDWIAGLALLRSIGHVLDKVDRPKSAKHQTIISSKWENWKTSKTENWVFWEFIEQERNNILKEFDLGFVTEPYMEPNEYELEPIVFEKLDEFREAVYWWRFQLREVEREVPST